MMLSKIMTSSVTTVGLDDDLAKVKEIFDHCGFHHLLVAQRGILYGVVSDTDMLQALSPFIGTSFESSRDHATLNKRVHHIMTRQPPTLGPEADVFDAIALFESSGVDCIPIVDHERKILGIVSWRDIMKLLHRNREKFKKS